jgi:hypothetical protein
MKKDDKNEKFNLLADLIKLAKADNELRDIEFDFLLNMAVQMGVTKEDFKLLFEQYIAFLPPKLEADRIIQFHRLVLLMNVDAKVSTEELDYIKETGIRMGLNSLATNDVLRLMSDYPNNVIPSEKLIELFGLYHN